MWWENLLRDGLCVYFLDYVDVGFVNCCNGGRGGGTDDVCAKLVRILNQLHVWQCG